MTDITRRVQKLEEATDPGDVGPGWVAVAKIEDLDLLDLKQPTKVYIGFLGPGEWDNQGVTSEEGQHTDPA